MSRLDALRYWWNHWKPFIHGNDGLTSRERLAYTREYKATIGTPGQITMSPGCYHRDLADAHAHGIDDALRPVRDLIRHARLISPSERAVIDVADLERALGIDAPVPHKLGGNE